MQDSKKASHKNFCFIESRLGILLLDQLLTSSRLHTYSLEHLHSLSVLPTLKRGYRSNYLKNQWIENHVVEAPNRKKQDCFV